MTEERYQILNGLPPYGPMYVPISDDEDPFYSEGFVVRFRKLNGEEWVANFKLGWTDYSNVFCFKEHIMVFAGGLGYVMNPDEQEPKMTFGLSIKNVIQQDNLNLICSTDTNILIFESESGTIWESDRISWDGIKDLEIVHNKLIGKAYNPTNSTKPWSDFELDLETREIKGGSF